MERNFTALESLESRRLMSSSVSAATLAGPLSAGTTWVYANPSQPTIQTTIIVHGAVRLGHVKAIRIDAGTKSGHTKLSSSSYVNFGASGYSLLQDASSNNRNTNKSSEVYTPSAVLFPTAMKAKVVYRYHWAGTTTDTVSGSKTTSTESVDLSIKLSSTTLTKIHTAAGTFKCYTVVSTTASTSSGSTDTSTETMYFAAGVGLVKEVTVDSGTTSVLELQSFKAG